MSYKDAFDMLTLAYRPVDTGLFFKEIEKMR
jgi:hypothetical protein